MLYAILIAILVLIVLALLWRVFTLKVGGYVLAMGLETHGIKLSDAETEIYKVFVVENMLRELFRLPKKDMQ